MGVEHNISPLQHKVELKNNFKWDELMHPSAAALIQLRTNAYPQAWMIIPGHGFMIIKNAIPEGSDQIIGGSHKHVLDFIENGFSPNELLEMEEVGMIPQGIEVAVTVSPEGLCEVVYEITPEPEQRMRIEKDGKMSFSESPQASHLVRKNLSHQGGPRTSAAYFPSPNYGQTGWMCNVGRNPKHALAGAKDYPLILPHQN